MNASWKYFLFLTLSCLVVQGFYAMIEMACVSFNKVRLQYYVSKGQKRAKWLSFLLNHPPLLFGTTLISVNTALQVGSESSRKFYESLSISPDWAPLTQIVIVLIFAEITPLLAGRRYAEHVAMLGIPILYATSLILRPLIWLFDLMCRGISRLFGSTSSTNLYLTREELQKVLEQTEEAEMGEGEEFNTVVSNIFSLKNKTAKELMQPLSHAQMVPSLCTISEMRSLLSSSYSPYLPIYHKTPENIVAVAYPRDLLRIEENKRVRDYARPPWFITEGSIVIEILKQFRRNSQSVAIVLNQAGLASGILTLDEIIDEIFGRTDKWNPFESGSGHQQIIVDRTFPGDMLLSNFNQQFHVHLAHEGAETLEELVTMLIGHPPTQGESARLDEFEFIIEEAPLIGVKQISVNTLNKGRKRPKNLS